MGRHIWGLSPSNEPVERPQPIPLNFPFQFLRRSGKPTLADEHLFCASAFLDVDRCYVADDVAFLVNLTHLYDFNVNRQPLEFRGGLAHLKPLFLFDSIDYFIAGTGIAENPCDGNDVAYGILVANGFGRILMISGRDRLSGRAVR
ncbi:UNVERIFIED_ORG: hypothetical protein GGD59_003870 [Rhizobium esperanzae]